MMQVESVKEAARRWCDSEHLANVTRGKWLPLHDEHGNVLEGIKGRAGAAGLRADGEELGIDLIEMAEGSAFPLHVHPGDHLLYFVSGWGHVHIDGTNHLVGPGDTVFIAADYPHGVQGPTAGLGPLVFLAIGVPHKHISAEDRMRLVGDEGV